jgi:hypothetical protein
MDQAKMMTSCDEQAWQAAAVAAKCDSGQKHSCQHCDWNNNAISLAGRVAQYFCCRTAESRLLPSMTLNVAQQHWLLASS